MDQNKNHGVLIAPPRPNDYILGGANQIPFTRIVKDWSIYLPVTENQNNNIADFLDCVSMAAGHEIEMNLNYLLSSNQLSDEALNFFHNNNYIQNGSFHISKRFNAKMSGTDKTKGNYLNVVADSFRNIGFISDYDYPMTSSMTWDEYYSPIPQILIDKAKKALWYVKIYSQFVNTTDIFLSLKIAPVQIASEVCAGWDSGQTVQKCSGQPLQHSTIIYGQDTTLNWLDFDSYSPYTKKLAADYELPLNMQYFVSVKPVALRNSMYGDNVLKLQQNLNKLDYKLSEDKLYGPITQKAVIDFQSKNGLSADGIAGPITLAKIQQIINTPHLSKIDAWCEAIKEMEGAKPERNNPGNIKYYAGVQNAVNDNGFCKFDTYQDGYNALKNLITSACSGNNHKYNPNGTLYQFYAGIPPYNPYEGYAPASDGNNPLQYSTFVANKIKCSVDTIIKTLL